MSFVRQIPVSQLGAASSLWARMSTCCVPHPNLAENPVRVLIAGTHPSLRSSLRTILEMDPYIDVVGEASDDCETVKMAKRLRPDVLLLDMDMHCCDDYEAIAEVSKRKLTKGIIGLTIHDDEVERNSAKDAGVEVILAKGISSRQLVEAVRASAASSGVAGLNPPPPLRARTALR